MSTKDLQLNKEHHKVKIRASRDVNYHTLDMNTSDTKNYFLSNTVESLLGHIRTCSCQYEPTRQVNKERFSQCLTQTSF